MKQTSRKYSGTPMSPTTGKSKPRPADKTKANRALLNRNLKREAKAWER